MMYKNIYHDIKIPGKITWYCKNNHLIYKHVLISEWYNPLSEVIEANNELTY